MGDILLEPVRVCAEIGIECTNFDPMKRPDIQHITERLDEMEHTCGVFVADLCTLSETEVRVLIAPTRTIGSCA